MSGLVTPDHMVLQRGPLGWRVIEQHPGDRSVEIRESAAGGVEHVRGTGGAASAVPIDVVKNLAKLGAQIAARTSGSHKTLNGPGRTARYSSCSPAPSRRSRPRPVDSSGASRVAQANISRSAPIPSMPHRGPLPSAKPSRAWCRWETAFLRWTTCGRRRTASLLASTACHPCARLSIWCCCLSA